MIKANGFCGRCGLLFLLAFLFSNRFDRFAKVSRFFGHVVVVAEFGKLRETRCRIAACRENNFCVALRA